MGWLIGLAVVLGAGLAVLRLNARPVLIAEGWQGVRTRDGQFDRLLPPGAYRRSLTGRTQVQRVSMQEFWQHGMTVSVLTADQFAFRLVLAPFCRVTDPRLLLEQPEVNAEVVKSYAAGLYIHLAAAAVAQVGAVTLDDFLARRDEIVAGIRALVTDALPGVTVTRLLLTEVTMPPEIRRMFTEIERARREGLAALERARAEQASLRALANAARSLHANPGLAQLRLIQAAEGAKGAKTFVLNATALGVGSEVPRSGTPAGPPLP